jgi:hypothetical protein
MEQENENDYHYLCQELKEKYTLSQMLDLCEKYKLSIYGNKEMIIDRLAYHLSEQHKRKDIRYRMMQCLTSIKSKWINQT